MKAGWQYGAAHPYKQTHNTSLCVVQRLLSSYIITSLCVVHRLPSSYIITMNTQVEGRPGCSDFYPSPPPPTHTCVLLIQMIRKQRAVLAWSDQYTHACVLRTRCLNHAISHITQGGFEPGSPALPAARSRSGCCWYGVHAASRGTAPAHRSFCTEQCLLLCLME